MLLARRSLLLATSLIMPALVLKPAFAKSTGASPVKVAPRVSGPVGRIDVRAFGAKGDGTSVDTSAINKAVDHVAALGGGTVYFGPGVYLSFSIRLKSKITLYLDQGAVLLAAPTPFEGLATGGYDLAEPMDPAVEAFQDFGHNHWHNSLIWGENIHDVTLAGPGLIWGKGLARDWHDEDGLGGSRKPGTGNKAIALKNCHNVLLRDVKILQGGWFCLLATGVDNLTIDNVTVDTNRDGFDIDCCRNVRIVNCTVNSPWDDGICPKSSYALGYPRATENVTISNCFLSGRYEMGSVIDGTWRQMPSTFNGTGRIKCGTESNGGFKNITVSNCVFEDSRGIALESVDGAYLEDVTISNITMRGAQNSPLFLRLGRRMRGPTGVPVGTLKRILISNITSFNGVTMPSTIAGVDGYPVEDVKISDVYLHQQGGLSENLSGYTPEAKEDQYPEPGMFGRLPATGFWVRHGRNIELSHIEVATSRPDNRPAIWLERVDGADIFNLKSPKGSAIGLKDVTGFRNFGSRNLPDTRLDSLTTKIM